MDVIRPCLIPSITYTDLIHNDTDIKDLATAELVQALKSYGACCIMRPRRAFFERKPKVKIADYLNSGATAKCRFVPFASEKIRGMVHLDETLEFQHGAYGLAGKWSVPGSQLVNASRHMHKECTRIHSCLLDRLSSWMNLPQSLNSIHSKENSFFAPYYYHFEGDEDNTLLRVPPHIDPTTMLFCFQDSHAGLHVADMTDVTGSISTAVVQNTARFIPVKCQPGEFVVLAGHILRRLISEIKHSVHFVERPLGTSGFHLNYWIIPDLDASCDFGGRKEDVAEYLARVFPAALRNTIRAQRG